MRFLLRVLAPVVAALGLIGWAFPALAQEVEPEEEVIGDCLADYGRVYCELDEWHIVTRRFEMPDAGKLQQGGWRGARVFTIDGYGRLMPAVSVLWRREGGEARNLDEQIDFRGIRAVSDAYVIRSLRRAAWWQAVAQAQWVMELAEGSPAEPDYDPEPNEDGSISICMHGWDTVTEVLDEGGVSRFRRTACNPDELFEATYDFSDIAMDGFGPCNLLDPQHHRNDSARLARCLSLLGDHVAAAEVANLFDGPINDDVQALGALTAPEFVLEWAEEGVFRGSAASAELARRLDEGDLWANDILGEAEVVYAQGGLNSAEHNAAMRQTWRRDPTGEWRLVHMVVSPPVPFDDP